MSFIRLFYLTFLITVACDDGGSAVSMGVEGIALGGADDPQGGEQGGVVGGGAVAGVEQAGETSAGEMGAGVDLAGVERGGASLTAGIEMGGVSVMAGVELGGSIVTGGTSAGVVQEGGSSAGEMSAGVDSAGGTDTAGTDTAGTDRAGTDTAGTDTAGTDTAGTDTAGTDTAGTDTAGTDTAGTDTAGAEVAGEMSAGVESVGGEMLAGMNGSGGEMIAGVEVGGEETPLEEPAYNLCGVGATATRAPGTNGAPIVAPYSPFVDHNSTLSVSQDLYDSYDCAPDRREFGREVVYQFTLPASGYFRAEVSDGLGVDIDLHLLQNPSVDNNGLVSGCLARDDSLIEYDNLPAGTYQLVADSWTNASGYEYEGAYQVAFEWLPYGQWTEAPITDSIALRRSLHAVEGQERLIHLLIADAGYQVTARRHAGCETVQAVRAREQAVVGINANFFSGTQCTPTDFLREAGVTLTRNSTTMFEQRSFGWDDASQLQARWLPYQADWTEVSQGVGGYPSLVINGAVAVQVREGEQVYSATDWSNQPRSAVAYTSSGQLVFAVADGRNRLSPGLFSVQWAQLLSSELDVQEAIGLDGGGSSSLVVQGCWLNDVVSFPSDSGDLSHNGSRPVGSGLYLE